MTYRNRPSAIEALIQKDQVHRALYISDEIFQLEQENFFANTWSFVGHGTQIPKSGDYLTLDIAGQPVLVLRDTDGTIRAFHNRCAHKGTKLYTSETGHIETRMMRCPYHAWVYRFDGSLAGYPLKNGYEGTELTTCEAGKGLTPVAGFKVYRDFLFARMSDNGPSFEEYFGEILAAIDQMVERSPTGELQLEGGVLRSVINCNWKLYIENINDSVHPVSAHESAVRAARDVWSGNGDDVPKPMSVEQILPFGAKYDFFESTGGKVYPNGHSMLGTKASIHSGYGSLTDYVNELIAARGEKRAHEILDQSPQNAVLYPSIAVKGSPQTIRVLRPISANKTVIEAWNFRTVGGPELLYDRALTYSRIAFSPMSIVAHDDIHLFEAQQKGFESRGNDWISLHREYSDAETSQPIKETSGTDELLIRNQYRAWAKFMTLNMKEG